MSLQMMAEHSGTNKGGKTVPEDRTYRIDYGRLEKPTILIRSLILKKNVLEALQWHTICLSCLLVKNGYMFAFF